ncbi:hypothetical protein, partial [Enterobacter hormaechei]|uniref:hypothetical protein n=1 Tax=Enterobacter hormaechei TaxID=158836 RepID=UPI003D70150A
FIKIPKKKLFCNNNPLCPGVTTPKITPPDNLGFSHGDLSGQRRCSRNINYLDLNISDFR